MSNFYTILTRVGAALHANAQVNQTTVPWTHMRLGDGNGAAVVPTENQTGLVRQVHTLQITDIAVHPDNPNWVIAEAVVPSDVGGWTVRETAIYGGADGNTCIAVGNYPETYKPVLAEGAGREMVMRMVVEISSVATVKLQIDPAVAIASRAWVESLVATPTKAGLVKLANEEEHLAGEVGNKAATPAGVQAMLDENLDPLIEKVGILEESVYFAPVNLRASASGTSAQVPITADRTCLENAAGKLLALRNVNVTVNTATVGVNGLDTGALAASTWYSKWVISNGTDVAGLISLSADAPMLPAGYTFKKRTGWIRTDASANKYPLRFSQVGSKVSYSPRAGSNLTGIRAVAQGIAGSVATPTWVAVSVADAVPSTAVSVDVQAILNGTNSSITVAPSNQYGSLGSSANPPPIQIQPSASGTLYAWLVNMHLESMSIYWASASAGNALFIGGWEDSL